MSLFVSFFYIVFSPQSQKSTIVEPYQPQQPQQRDRSPLADDRSIGKFHFFLLLRCEWEGIKQGLKEYGKKKNGHKMCDLFLFYFLSPQIWVP